MDREQLAVFLRARREALQPEDVGLTRGSRRRTTGLRREEVAALSGISSDYYTRIEQRRGPIPSAQVLAAIARGLHLTTQERNLLFQLAGHAAPARIWTGDHLNPGLMRILDRLDDTPAQVVNALGETLRQTPAAMALLGDETSFQGLERSRVYRWFTDPDSRRISPPEDHAKHSRALVADLVAGTATGRAGRRAQELVAALNQRSEEFRHLWAERPMPGLYCEPKRFLHPEFGELDLYGETLLDPDQSQALLIFTAPPGSESHEKLRLLSVIGTQRL